MSFDPPPSTSAFPILPLTVQDQVWMDRSPVGAVRPGDDGPMPGGWPVQAGRYRPLMWLGCDSIKLILNVEVTHRQYLDNVQKYTVRS